MSAPQLLCTNLLYVDKYYGINKDYSLPWQVVPRTRGPGATHRPGGPARRAAKKMVGRSFIVARFASLPPWRAQGGVLRRCCHPMVHTALSKLAGAAPTSRGRRYPIGHPHSNGAFLATRPGYDSPTRDAPTFSAPAPMDGEEVARRLRFEDAPGMGLVVTARRHCAVGEVVLAEAPLLRWPADSMLGLFRAYAALPALARQASMSLYRSPDPSVDPTYDSAVAFSEHLAETGRLPALDSSTSTTEAVATYAALAVTARLNAFAFDGVHGAQHLPGAAAMGAPRGGAGDWRALFANASRFEHSCAPNAVYSSAFGDGIARWTAIRPVAPGDRVAISYWVGHVWASTPARRAALRASHNFVCACVVCEAPDRRRAVSCRRRKCGGVATPPSWACCSCGRGAGAGDVEAKEQRMEAALAELREKRFGGRVEPAAVETLVTVARKALSPTHWTVVALLREVEDSCAAGCRAAMASSGGIIPLLFGHASGKNVGPLVGLQLRGIAACMHAIKAVECMEAGCGHGGPWSPTPPCTSARGWPFS